MAAQTLDNANINQLGKEVFHFVLLYSDTYCYAPLSAFLIY